MILKTAGAVLFLGPRHAYKCFYGPGATQRLEREYSNQERARSCPCWGNHVTATDRIARVILRSARGRAFSSDSPDDAVMAREFVEARLTDASLDSAPVALTDLLDRQGIKQLLGPADYRTACGFIDDQVRGATLPGGPAHGDLHAGNIVLVDGRPQVIDCDRYSRRSAPIFDRIHFNLAERRRNGGGRWFDVMLDNEDIADDALRADGITTASVAQTLLVYGLNRLAADARDRGARRRSSRKYARFAWQLIERHTAYRHSTPTARPGRPRGSAFLRKFPWARRMMLLGLWRAGQMLGGKVERPLLRIVNPQRRRFLPPGVSASAFFAQLDARQIDYVLLRWSQDLLRLDAKQDLDILVADRCVSATFRELSLWPIGRPVDLYSPSGISGTTYCVTPGDGDPVHLPVFPPHLSAQLLKRRVRRDDACFAPCPEDQFWSLAYHVAFLKGAASGIPLRSPDEALSPGRHDYAATLRDLAAAVGVPLDGDITRARLAEALRRNGLQAPEVRVARLHSPASV